MARATDTLLGHPLMETEEHMMDEPQGRRLSRSELSVLLQDV